MIIVNTVPAISVREGSSCQFLAPLRRVGSCILSTCGSFWAARRRAWSVRRRGWSTRRRSFLFESAARATSSSILSLNDCRLNPSWILVALELPMQARPVALAARSVLLKRVVEHFRSKSRGQLISTELCLSEPSPEVCISADIPSKTHCATWLNRPNYLRHVFLKENVRERLAAVFAQQTAELLFALFDFAARFGVENVAFQHAGVHRQAFACFQIARDFHNIRIWDRLWVLIIFAKSENLWTIVFRVQTLNEKNKINLISWRSYFALWNLVKRISRHGKIETSQTISPFCFGALIS